MNIKEARDILRTDSFSKNELKKRRNTLLKECVEDLRNSRYSSDVIENKKKIINSAYDTLFNTNTAVTIFRKKSLHHKEDNIYNVELRPYQEKNIDII